MLQRLHNTLRWWAVPVVIGMVVVGAQLPPPYTAGRWVDASLLIAAGALCIIPVIWPSILTIVVTVPMFLFACFWRAFTLVAHADGLRAISGPIAWLVIGWMWTLVVVQAVLRLSDDMPLARRRLRNR